MQHLEHDTPTIWDHIPENICTLVPTSWRHVNIFHEIQKSIVNPNIHRESIICSTIHIYPGRPGPPRTPSPGARGWWAGAGRVGLDKNVWLKHDGFTMDFWILQNMFRNLVPDFLTCPQLVGTWVKNIFRSLVTDFGHVLLSKRVTFTKGGGFLLSDGSSHGGVIITISRVIVFCLCEFKL